MSAAGRLTGELAIVTGSTSGLGIAIAQRFVAEGARVVVTGRDRARGEAAAARTDATFVPADLAAEAGCRSLIDEAVRVLGGLTVLVNNARAAAVAVFPADASAPARAGTDGPVADVTWDTWEDVLRVGMVSAGRLCALAIPHMRTAGHGSIVNISSRAAGQGTPRLAAYTASKAGLEALARSITADYAREGIRCNTVRPGYIVHEDRDKHLTTEQRDRYEQMHLTRLVTAEDVTNAALFLASSEAEVVSGVTIPVDGGSSAVRGRVLG